MPDEIIPDDPEREDDFADEEEDSIDEPEEADEGNDDDDADSEEPDSARGYDDEREEPRRRATSNRKKRAEQQKAAQSGSPKSKRTSRGRGERTEASSRRNRREPTEDRSKAARRRAGAVPRNRKRRKEPREAESWDLVEPKRPPEPEVDLNGEIEPVWERGVVIGGGCGLTAVACAVVALLMSGSALSVLSVVGIMVMLVAMVLGGIGVFARKSWGYVVSLGAGGLGTGAGLLWTLYCVVTPQLSPWGPFSFLVFAAAGLVALFHMRWGPGPFADDRERFRALERRLRSYTTVHGEMAVAGSLAAVLATVVCGFMLMGSASSSGKAAGGAPQMPDGMQLETLTTAPELNDMVLARWGNEEYFFLGRVEQQRSGEEFRIAYLDGDQAWVRLRDLRRDAVAAGATVHVHIQGHDGWLPAVITQRSNNRVEANVGGSQRVWVPLSMVRIREAS